MAAFHVENERIATFRELLAHHRRRDQRDAFHGRCHVPQRIELLVGWDERRRLADDAGADGTQDSLEFADIKIGAIPRIDSSLSSVPPVWPSPRPDIFGTITPHAAAIGARTIDTLSPTPPGIVLANLDPWNVGKIDALTGLGHRLGEPGGLLL